MTEILIGRNDSTSVGLDPHYRNRHCIIGTMGGQLRRQIPHGVLDGIFDGKC